MHRDGAELLCLATARNQKGGPQQQRRVLLACVAFHRCLVRVGGTGAEQWRIESLGRCCCRCHKSVHAEPTVSCSCLSLLCWCQGKPSCGMMDGQLPLLPARQLSLLPSPAWCRRCCPELRCNSTCLTVTAVTPTAPTAAAPKQSWRARESACTTSSVLFLP